MTTHRGVAAVQLHEERELEMLASLERLRKSRGSPRVSELAQALHVSSRGRRTALASVRARLAPGLV